MPRRELQPPEYDGPGVRYRDAMAALDAALPDGVDIVVDAGNIGAAAIHHLPVRRDGRFVVALGMGGMGYSFGAGIGMCAFGRRRRTVVIAGDGSFFMHGMEIHTAIQYRLPVTFVLFNNNAHAMCVTREQLFYGDLYSYNRFGPSRLGAGLAAMFPGSAVGRRRRTIERAARRAAGCARTSTARRWSASNARPTKSRRLHLSRQRGREQPFIDRGEHARCRCPRLTTSPPTGHCRTDRRGHPHRDFAAGEGDADHHGDDAVGVSARRGVRRHICTVNDYIDCPPDELFDYLADTRSLEEWTYSLRGFTPTDEPGLWLAYDRLGSETEIYTRTVANREARTVDYHCAWDQGKHLWMIYLMRVVDAQVVFDKPGSVVLWTNCHHPFYDHNPYPETAPPQSGRCGSATSGTCSVPAICWN